MPSQRSIMSVCARCQNNQGKDMSEAEDKMKLFIGRAGE